MYAKRLKLVRAAIGAQSPGYDLLCKWRSGAKIPSFEQLLMLIWCAEKHQPGKWAHRADVRTAWVFAAEREWARTQMPPRPPETRDRCGCGKPATKVEGEAGFTKCDVCYFGEAS
jgi:hypothetical protein